MKKNLIVISGGGFSQVESGIGTLKAMKEFGIEVNDNSLTSYRGTSAGAILSTIMSRGVTPDEMISIIKKNPTETLIEKRNWWWIKMFAGKSIYEREGFEDLLKHMLTRDATFSNVEVKVTRVKTMKAVDFTGFFKSVLASSSIEGIFEPVTIGDEKYIDGGYTDNVPFESWMAKNFENIYIILYPRDPNEIRHKKTYIGRLLEGFSTKLSQEVNEAEEVYSKKQHYPNITVLRPNPIETSLLSWSKNFKLLEWAYENAKEKLK